MANILHIDSSPRASRSHSRKLTGEFIESWTAAHPGDKVIYKDLGHNPVPHVTEEWVAAAFTSPEERTAELNDAIKLSDELVDEFLQADAFVFSVPMYNFNVPSTFKAYIDQIVRVNRTFNMKFEGLVKGKKMLIVTSRGANFEEGTPLAPYDFQEPYLRTIFGFIGIEDITFVHAQSINLGEEARDKSIEQARQNLQKLVTTW
ncbi:MAG: FMN-dependent NADH-azoreductase [Candidatus Caenarcaniphilales bacterium]|nr:FMN-dependent NADH-azoreductase [Candidatus Caenarcaniphilales bacterium]